MEPNAQELTQKKRFSKAMILQILREHETGHAIEEICKRHAINETQFYHWRDLYRPERYNVLKKLERLEKELKQYEVALLLQAEQIRVLNEIVNDKFKE